MLQNPLTFKQYPCCSGTHPVLDLTKELVKYSINFQNIANIHIGCSLLAKKELNIEFAKTGLKGKFCMRYAVATMIIYKNVEIKHFSDEFVRDKRVQDLMKKIDISVDDEFAKLCFIGNSPVKITITLNDKKQIKGSHLFAKGTPNNPLSNDELKAKFYSLTSSLQNQNKLYDMLMNLEEFEWAERWIVTQNTRF
ncbi:MAG: MmgE/PrpD family protein [Campylobacter sp.]|nr:MmgE/PrpD family protein [Campylobacter sp.]